MTMGVSFHDFCTAPLLSRKVSIDLTHHTTAIPTDLMLLCVHHCGTQDRTRSRSSSHKVACRVRHRLQTSKSQPIAGTFQIWAQWQNWKFLNCTMTTLTNKLLIYLSIYFCGPGSSVGIATGYGLEGPGIESRWGGEIFHTCPDPDPLSLLYNGYRVFPVGRMRPERDADPSPLLVPGYKNKLELYLYSP
jgi:hypothetical protein